MRIKWNDDSEVLKSVLNAIKNKIENVGVLVAETEFLAALIAVAPKYI